MSYQFTAGRFKGWASDNTPLAGGRLYTYSSGTTTHKAAYTDATLGAACTYVSDGVGGLYIALDSKGEAQLWLGSGAYTFKLTDSSGSTVWTVDGVRDQQDAAKDYTDTLRADLASTASGKGGALIGYILSAAGAVARTVLDWIRDKPVSPKDFGAVADGVADDAAAIRRAFDTGKDVDFGGPENTYYVGSVVYIPRGSTSRRLFGSATLKGPSAGVGTIFETGRQTYSTGATSSFGTNEAYLHYNTVVEGLRFKDCEFALKLNNFLQGCIIRGVTAGENDGVKTLIYARRCFYMNVLNNSHLGAFDPAVPVDTDACFRFEDNNNGMVIQGNSALRSDMTKGAGFHFSAGTAAVQFTGNTAERCGKGLYIGGAIYGMGVRDNYFEGNTVDVALVDGNYKRGLEIDANWFYSATAVQAVAWYSGELGPNNHYQAGGAVTISSTLGGDGALNSVTVYLPRAVHDDVSHRSALVVPANWSLNGSIIVKRQVSTYLNATGPSASRHMLAEEVLGGTQIVPRHFVGRSNLRTAYTDGGVPFASLTDNTNPGPGTLVVDTQLAWDAREMGARFDFYITDSGGNHQLSGWVNGTSVFRDDASAKTITAAINGSNNLQLTIGSFTVVSAARGGVRIL